MNRISSLLTPCNHYYSKKQLTQQNSGFSSIPVTNNYQQNGLNALSSYNQSAVSFKGLNSGEDHKSGYIIPKAIQKIKAAGTTYKKTFYDDNPSTPKKESISMPDGTFVHIKYHKNGHINTVTEVEPDNRTLIKHSVYHYKEDSDKISNIVNVYGDNTSSTDWFNDNEDIYCTQYSENGKLVQTDWYYEDGKTVKVSHIPLDDGGLIRSVYDKEGRILTSDITKPDQKTIEESTTYYYKENSKNYFFTKTTYEETKSIETWYNDNETATCSLFKENDIRTKAIWYFEDGETPNIEELYLADGRTQKVTMEKNGRWNNFTEFSSDGSMNKTTQYFYKDDNSENPESSITKYNDGKEETVWYDENEVMRCRQTKENDILKKIEWFHKDGETPKIVRIYSSETEFTEQQFDEKGNLVS